MKLSVQIENCQIVSALEGENHDLSDLIKDSGDDTILMHSGWEIRVHINRSCTDGDIIVKHMPDESFSKKIQKRYRLVDGYIAIDDTVAHPVHFTRTPIASILSERFGITELVTKDINGTDMTVAWDTLGRSGEVKLAYMLGDGKCTYSCALNGESNTPLVDLSEDMILYQGEITLKIAQSTWAVLCEYRKSEHDFSREVTLYTTRPNIYLLARDLDVFLEEASYDRFEDCLEALILE